MNQPDWSVQWQQLKDIIDGARHIVFFGGAGVSTESGIPDFRSQNGLYNTQYKYPPETIVSHSFLMQHPAEFYRFYRDKMLPQGILPNVTHRVLARWEQQGKLDAIVTQNIDNLHEMAGSRRIYKLHGSTDQNYCMRCGRSYGVDAILGTTGVPYCDCGGMIRPRVVLYEESLDGDVVEGAVRAIEGADVLLVCGTSLVVYPAAGLLQYFGGKYLVLINRDATSYDRQAHLVIHRSLGDVFSRFEE